MVTGAFYLVEIHSNYLEGCNLFKTLYQSAGPNGVYYDTQSFSFVLYYEYEWVKYMLDQWH